MTSKRPVFSVEMSFGWRRIAFVSFISRAHFKAQVSAVKSLELVKPCESSYIGHMDNRRRFSNESKMFRLGKQTLTVSEKFNLFRNFIFPVESTEKGLCVFHGPNQNFRFPFLKTATPAMYRKRSAARNWRHQTLLIALCWLFDVKRLVTHWLLSWFPFRQIWATIASQTRASNQPT